MPHALIITAVALLAAPTSPVAAAPEAPPVKLLPDVPSVVALAAGDLNGDGKCDLAVCEAMLSKTPDRKPQVFRLHLLFQKNGVFAMPPDKSIDLPACPSGLAVGDFDKDGRNDVAVGLRGIRAIALFLGSEGFANERRSQYNNDSGAGGLSAGRVNTVGRADFLTGAAWRQWQGEDRFAVAYFAGPERNDNWRSTLADLDGNGMDDVIFTTYWSGKLATPANNRIRIYYGPFLKMFILQPTDAAEVVTLNSPFMDSDKQVLGQVMVGDLNGDDQPDLVVPASGQTLIYFQNSPTGFSNNANPSLVLKNATPLLVTDLDGDKLCDVAFRSANGTGIALWHQRKDKPLTGHCLEECRSIALPREIAAVAAGDMDGDGRQEIVAALTGGGLAIVSLPRP